MTELQEIKKNLNDRCDDLMTEIHQININQAQTNEKINNMVPPKEIIELLAKHDTILKIHNWAIALIITAMITGAAIIIRETLI